MSLPVNPSRVARFVAGRVWGNPVQSSKKLAAGVFGYSTPGHGGIVAVVGVADLDARHLDAARATNRIETVAVVPNGRGGFKLAGPSSEYHPGVLEDWARRYNGTTCEVWIGEEDCEYAALLLAAPAARENAYGRYLAGPMPEDTYADLLETARRWSEDYIAELEGPDYVPMPGGQLETAARRAAILESGDPLCCSALNAGHDRVHVLFRGGDGETVGYYMSADTYRAIPNGDLATPDRFAEFGDLEPAPAAFGKVAR